MNDPNGFCYYNGQYHLFYQHHPYGPYWDDMHWGHVRSQDLVHWEGLPVALAPSEPYDRDGCFSGSAFEKDGKIYLMYTGNRWTGPDRDADLLQVQCLAESADGIRFEKPAGNPVIAEAPAGIAHPHHFRDPKVWAHEGTYYCILGSRTPGHVGQALLYKSADLANWEFVGVMAAGASRADDGFMWECPDLFALDGADVLLLSPQGMAPREERYRNLHQAGFMIGRLDYATGAFAHGGFDVLDHGFDYYAPQSALTPDGRRVVVAWMAMWESSMPEQARGWAGAMTLPRELTLEGGRLRSRPARELEALRGGRVFYTDACVESGGTLSLEGVEGDCCELELQLDVSQAGACGLRFRSSADGSEYTELRYEREAGMLTLDRERSGAGPGGIRNARLQPSADGLLSLRAFIDRSSVEVFAQDGEIAMTARIYPGEASNGIVFFAEGGGMKIMRVSKWDLRRKDGHTEGVMYGE